MIRFSLINVQQSGAKLSDFANDEALCKFFGSDEEYVNDSDRKRSRLGKIRVVELLLDAGVSRDKLMSIQKSEKGKWYLSDSEFDFNVAHSHDFVACAVSDDGMVGVDIEKTRLLDWGTYRDCFTRDEFTGILGSRKPEQYFFNLWTKKESLLKAWGDGLSIELADAIIEGNEGHIRGTAKRGYFYAIPVEGYACVVCSTVANQDVRMIG